VCKYCTNTRLSLLFSIYHCSFCVSLHVITLSPIFTGTRNQSWCSLGLMTHSSLPYNPSDGAWWINVFYRRIRKKSAKNVAEHQPFFCRRMWRVLHFLSLVLTTHSRDFSLSVIANDNSVIISYALGARRHIILDNLGSLGCCHVATRVLISGVIDIIYLLYQFSLWIWQYSCNLFVYLLSSKSMTIGLYFTISCTHSAYTVVNTYK